MLALSATPAANAAGVGLASPSMGRLDAVIRHDGNGVASDANADSLVQLTRTNGTWGAPVNIGGSVHKDSEIALASASTGTLALAVRSPQNAIRVRMWSATSGWGPWGDVGQNATAGPSITAWGGKLVLVWRNAAGTVDVRQWAPKAGSTRNEWHPRGTLTSHQVLAGTAPSIFGKGALQLVYMHATFKQPMVTSYFGPEPVEDNVGWDDPYFQNLLGTPALSTPSQGAALVWGGFGTNRVVRRFQPAVGSTPAQYVEMGGPVAGSPTTSRPGESTLPNTPASSWSSRLTTSSYQGDLIWRSDNGCLQTRTKTDAAANGVWTAQARIPQPATLTSGRCVWPGRVAAAAKPSDNGPAALPDGTVRYFGRVDGSDGWDTFFGVNSSPIPHNTPAANRTWINSKFWRLEVFNENESQTAWFPGGMVYYQLYTIDDAAAAAHPEWVLKADDGSTLYANDGGNPRTLKAGNIFDPGYRKYQIDRLNQLFSQGDFKGLWLDNVNLELGDSGLVKQVTSPAANSWVGAFWDYQATHKAMAASGAFPAGENCAGGAITSGTPTNITDSCWAVGIAAFVSEIKAALPPGKELLTNTPFYRFMRNVDTNTYGNSGLYEFINSGGQPNRNLPTAPGRSVVDSATYVDYEYAFWNGPNASGLGADGTNAGISWDGYSLDSVFRWIDGVHARGKGIVADSSTAGDVTDIGSNPTNIRRVQEFKLAAYFLVNNGRDGFGDYNRTSANWPTITGSGGTYLYEMNLGSAAALPAGVPASGAGSTGRGVVTKASSGLNRLWLRKFARTDGKKVFVLLNEPGTGAGSLTGSSLSYAIPQTGCSDMTTSTAPGYRSLSVSGTTTTVTVAPRAAAFVLCN